MKWYNNGNCDGIILSTRVRLARNLSEYAFSTKLSEEARARMIKDVRDAFDKFAVDRYNYVDMTLKNNIEKMMLVEEHIISRDFAAKPDTEKRMLVYDENGSVSVMIGEEDHLRIQAVRAGFNIKEACEAAYRLEELLSRGLDFAFDEKLGYLTCCPSNTGTGLRVSCMLHLPMLTRNGYIKSIIEFCTRLGLTVRGFYGEGSEADGEIYQISNQITLGITEEETAKRISDAVKSIEEKEFELRQKLKEAGTYAQDKLWRSYGIMQNARCMSSGEFLKLWSDCMLAKNCGFIERLSSINLIQLLIECMPAHIMIYNETAKDATERDILRAEKIRDYLK